MHKNLPKKYYFINTFNKSHIKKLDKNIAIIYRDYSKKNNQNLIKKINNFCKFHKRKFLISNDIKLAFKLNLDGVYLPSFNRNLRVNSYVKKKNFIVLGSAHNIKEIRIKEKQGLDAIFLSSLFKKKKTYLGLEKFKLLSKLTKMKTIALGGINNKNINKIKLLNNHGFAAISFFNKK